MVDSPDNFSLFNRNDVQGLVTEHVVKNLRLVPYLDMHNSGDAEEFIFDTIDKTAEEDIASKIMSTPVPRALGGKLDIVRMSGMTPNAQPLLMSGYTYEVETNKIKKRPYSVEYFLKRMAYGIGRALEYDAHAKCIAKASADIAAIDNTWDKSTEIDMDLIDMKAAFRDESLPDTLTGLFYDSTNHTELQKFIRNQEGSASGYIEDSFNWLGITHAYSGSMATHGTAIGFDITNPPAVVAYGIEEGAYNPKVTKGMEGYAPIINVKVKRVADEIPDITKIFMAAKYTIAVLEPNALMAQTGL